jgi:hypothetical protein
MIAPCSFNFPQEDAGGAIYPCGLLLLLVSIMDDGQSLQTLDKRHQTRNNFPRIRTDNSNNNNNNKSTP